MGILPQSLPNCIFQLDINRYGTFLPVDITITVCTLHTTLHFPHSHNTQHAHRMLRIGNVFCNFVIMD